MLLTFFFKDLYAGERQEGLFVCLFVFKKKISLKTKNTFDMEADSFIGKIEPEVYSCQKPPGNTSGCVLLE